MPADHCIYAYSSPWFGNISSGTIFSTIIKYHNFYRSGADFDRVLATLAMRPQITMIASRALLSNRTVNTPISGSSFPTTDFQIRTAAGARLKRNTTLFYGMLLVSTMFKPRHYAYKLFESCISTIF
jgi:hypothetical protein